MHFSKQIYNTETVLENAPELSVLPIMDFTACSGVVDIEQTNKQTDIGRLWLDILVS